MNNSVVFILFGFLLSMLTCSDEEVDNLLEDPTRTDRLITYVIPAGTHSSGQSAYKPLTVHGLKFNAVFDSSAVYRTSAGANQGDINKLYGMSDCNSPHHENSARFGWRWFEGSLEIWAYAYVDGKRKMSRIGEVSLNKVSNYELTFTDSSYHFRVDTSVADLPRHCNEKATGYKLYPWFGGDETAPHDIRIKIEDLP